MPTVDLGPQDIAAKLAERLKNSLEATDCVLIIETKVAVNQLHLLARVKKDTERDLIYGPVKEMLKVVKKGEDFFFGKSYFMRNNKLKYAWVFSVGAMDIEAMVSRLIDAIGSATRRSMPKVDIMDIPLLGQQAPISTRIGMKGAMPVSPRS